MTNAGDVAGYLSAVRDGKVELAQQILDVINNEKLDLPERIVRVRRICIKNMTRGSQK